MDAGKAAGAYGAGPIFGTQWSRQSQDTGQRSVSVSGHVKNGSLSYGRRARPDQAYLQRSAQAVIYG